MKLALAIMFTNELPWLKLHVPVMMGSFDGIVGMTDPNTTDGSVEYLASLGAVVHSEKWISHWGHFATRMAYHAEQHGYDALCRIDPDECLMPDAGDIIRELLEKHASLLVLPRYEFFGDRLNYRRELYPDHQARAWRLNRGILVQGARHEGIDFTRHGLFEHETDPDKRVMRVTAPAIYHYGYASETGIRDNMLKYQQHAHVSAGLTPPQVLSPDEPTMRCETVPFDWPQPLDPTIVGATAPWSK